MGRKKKKDKENKNDANVHSDLEGLEININPFGEIETNYDIQKINEFLNKNVSDKKLKEREELKKKGLSMDDPERVEQEKRKTKKTKSSSDKSKEEKKKDSSGNQEEEGEK